MDWHEKNIRVYDESARELANYFGGIGSRIEDIERGLSLAGEAEHVVEIGCGDGRDAAEIVTRVKRYEGFDPSKGLLAIAREKVPQASFVEADALSYDYPEGTDVVFAFASLLHVGREDLSAVFRKVAGALRPGGIFYISLKARAEYAEEVKRDQYGERMFYYYNPALIQDIAGETFSTAYLDEYVVGHTGWFTIALKKEID